MNDRLRERIDAARALADLDTDELSRALLAMDDTVRAATARFVPPDEPLSRAELELLERETAATIALIESRMAAVAAEISQLPQARTPTTETGTRIDFSG